MAIILPNGSAPGTPAAGKIEVYSASSDKKLKTIDENGLVRTMLEESSTLYRLIRVTEIFNGTTSYTPTSGADALFVECVGGGGQGGGVATAATNAGAGGGGGGGGYACLWTTSIKTFTVSVGAGGSTSVAGNNAGQDGADTTFDSPSICTAKGGLGGGPDTIAVGPRVAGIGNTGGSGASGVGDFAAWGGNGGYGLALAAAQAVSGWGGSSFFAGSTAQKATQGTGIAGRIYGGGGSGGCAVSGGASVAGGAGANGIIRVAEFQAIT